MPEQDMHRLHAWKERKKARGGEPPANDCVHVHGLHWGNSIWGRQLFCKGSCIYREKKSGGPANNDETWISALRGLQWNNQTENSHCGIISQMTSLAPSWGNVPSSCEQRPFSCWALPLVDLSMLTSQLVNQVWVRSGPDSSVTLYGHTVLWNKRSRGLPNLICYTLPWFFKLLSFWQL